MMDCMLSMTEGMFSNYADFSEVQSVKKVSKEYREHHIESPSPFDFRSITSSCCICFADVTFYSKLACVRCLKTINCAPCQLINMLFICFCQCSSCVFSRIALKARDIAITPKNDSEQAIITIIKLKQKLIRSNRSYHDTLNYVYCNVELVDKEQLEGMRVHRQDKIMLNNKKIDKVNKSMLKFKDITDLEKKKLLAEMTNNICLSSTHFQTNSLVFDEIINEIDSLSAEDLKDKLRGIIVDDLMIMPF